MNNNVINWQIPAWEGLRSRQSRLPHALLLNGPPGLGKSFLAQRFAQLLLCQSPEKGEPCKKCPACGWLAMDNHPDFRLVQPESMAPESEESSSKKEKKKSEQIRIEQIRDLESFLAVGTHRGGLRVVIIDPADTMNLTTQNALLKGLEEPAPSTLFLLVTSRPQQLLPTIRSRCQAVTMARPPQDEALQWLREEGIAHPEAALAAAAGAPLAAVAAAQWTDSLTALIGRLSKPGFNPISLAQACEAFEPPMVVGWLQRWIYDLLHMRATGSVRYHPGLESEIGDLAKKANTAALTDYFRQLIQAQALARHPLNQKLFFEGLFVQYLAALKTSGPG